jgi:putative ABC transport system ATP-binding protein
MNLIELESVSKHYLLGEVRIEALSQVNLEIREGEFLAITGPSGSGKSTLLNLMGCLDLPSDGQVRVMGKSTSECSERELDLLRGRTLGMIFQSFNLVPVLSARENVALPLHLQRLDARERDERVRHGLASVGIEKFADVLPDKLSGGQRQRVGIARALVTRPKVILADEPTANLDSGNALAIIEIMRELNREQGVTFVFSTHDDRLLNLVDEVVTVRDGRIEQRLAAVTGRPVAAEAAA